MQLQRNRGIPRSVAAVTVSAALTPSTLPAFDHVKPRYSSRKVCEIFEISPRTLRRWLNEGVPLRDGRKLTLHSIPLGPRKTVFEKEEVERVYRELREVGQEGLAEILPFRREVTSGFCSRCTCTTCRKNSTRRA